MKKQSNLKKVIVVSALLFCAASAFAADTSELDRLTDEGVKAYNEADYSLKVA